MSIDVLEGPDLSGKTTIARQLMSRPQPRCLLKQGPPLTDVGGIMSHYLKPLEDMIGRADIHTVMDRWHVGELIYGPLLRGKSLLTSCQADYIDMVLQTFGARFYHITDSIETLKERYDQRGDGLIKKEQLFDITMSYDEWMFQRTHWVMHSQAASSYVFNAKPRMHSHMAGQYIGPDNPKVLLLGDRRNDHRMIFPFVPERATSGHWLMGALATAGVNHMHVGIMNACEGDIDEDTLLTQWEALGQPPVVTLGNNARAAWEKTQPIRRRFHLNHPQYERRFHYTKMSRYGKIIKEVMDHG